MKQEDLMNSKELEPITGDWNKPKDTGKPCIDNTWFTSSDLYINKEPIVLDIEVKNPETFGQALAELFNF